MKLTKEEVDFTKRLLQAIQAASVEENDWFGVEEGYGWMTCFETIQKVTGVIYKSPEKETKSNKKQLRLAKQNAK